MIHHAVVGVDTDHAERRGFNLAGQRVLFLPGIKMKSTFIEYFQANYFYYEY
jgi:hypothetical protein